MQDFAGAYGECMYLLDMAIRPEALPTDAVALTEMVLAREARHERRRGGKGTLNDMSRGMRRERRERRGAAQVDRTAADVGAGLMRRAPRGGEGGATRISAGTLLH